MLKTLPQQKNNLIVNGIVKNRNLEHITFHGDDAIRGNVTVQYQEDNKVNTVSINVFAPSKSKSGKDMPSYHSVDVFDKKAVNADDDKANATHVHISGRIQYDVFTTKTGRTIKTLRLNGAFFHEITANEKDNPRFQPMCRADMNLTVTGYRPEIVNEKPTGNLLVNNLSVGYGQRIATIPGLKFDLSVFDNVDDVKNALPSGSTVHAQIDFNNFAVIDKEHSAQAHGFGAYTPMATATKFVKQNVIHFVEAKAVSGNEALDADQIKQAQQLLDNNVAKKSNGNMPKAPAKKPADAPKTNFDKDISNDDLPF